jgi:hypothetical protein
MKKIGLSLITSLILTGNLYSGNYDFGCNSDDDVTVAMNKFKENFDNLTEEIKQKTNGSKEQKILMEERSKFLENEKPKLEKLKKAMKCATYEAEFNKNYKTNYKDQKSSRAIHFMLQELKKQSLADRIIHELTNHQIPALKSWGVSGLYGYEISLEKKGLVINLLTLNGLKKIDISSDSYNGKDGVGIDGNKIIVRTNNKSYSLSPDYKYRDQLAEEIADVLNLTEIDVLKPKPIPTNNEDEKENGENTTNQAKDGENKKENGENKKDSEHNGVDLKLVESVVSNTNKATTNKATTNQYMVPTDYNGTDCGMLKAGDDIYTYIDYDVKNDYRLIKDTGHCKKGILIKLCNDSKCTGND